jgi:hypothetical protein
MDVAVGARANAMSASTIRRSSIPAVAVGEAAGALTAGDADDALKVAGTFLQAVPHMTSVRASAADPIFATAHD